MDSLREVLADLSDGPFADLLESDDAYLVVMDVPGATRATTTVEYENGRLRVDASRSKDVPSEFRFVREDRSIFMDTDLPVPPDASGSEASATIDSGVLEIRLPKTHAAGHEIAIE